MLDQLYQLAFTICDRDGQCGECPFREDCDDFQEN